MEVAGDVVLLRWPAEQSRREDLRAAGRPRVLLVENGAPPPTPMDDLEDWVRVPAGEIDVRARVDAVRDRALRGADSSPHLDADGVLRVGDRVTVLPPVEARLAAALLDRAGAVVPRAALGRAGWPDGAPGRNALDVHVLRLRRRLAPVGLSIRTVRSRGYLLDAASASRQQGARQA